MAEEQGICPTRHSTMLTLIQIQRIQNSTSFSLYPLTAWQTTSTATASTPYTSRVMMIAFVTFKEEVQYP